MDDHDEYTCRCCGQRRPVLSLAIAHEKRCAADHGMILEPRARNL